jgi:hypothetical protein
LFNDDALPRRESEKLNIKLIQNIMNTENQKSTTETLYSQGGVMTSFLLLTKEHYSDGVSEEYEDIIKASDIEKAKLKADIKIMLRNKALGKYGKCFFIHVSPC